MLSGYSDIRAAFDAFASSGLPVKGEAFPNFPGLRAKDFSLVPVDGHADLWKLNWSYEVVSAGFIDAPTVVPETLPNEVSYVETASEIRAFFEPAWRIEAVYPDDGTVEDPTLDIRGKKIDQAGVPLSVQRNQQDLTVTETVEEPQFDRYRSFRFTRNSTTFLGAGRGRVLYRGASVRRTGVEVYQVSHSFVEDLDFHLQQTPLIDQDGDAIRKIDRKHADEVYWVQPFPSFSDFNTISTNF